MKKSNCLWVALACFFGGIALGFLISPIKRGIGNNSGNHYYYHDCDETDVEPEGLA